VARLAAERITDSDLSILTALTEEMIRAAEAGQVREMSTHDVEFHLHVCSLADHTLLSRLWWAVNPHLWTYVAIRGLLLLPPVEAARRHFDVIDGLRSRDPDRAEAAMRRHMLELHALAREKLPEHGIPDE
jgi:DNA-binding GntR family transcriptional regulator